MSIFPGHEDVYLFKEGTWNQSYKKLGAHSAFVDGENGYLFVVWAPNAGSVSVAGSFNGWSHDANVMEHDESGEFWGTFIKGVKKGDLYKYVITDSWGNKVLKADPYAFYAEKPSDTASVIYDIPEYNWTDYDWMNNRKNTNHMEKPLNIYEVHLGSWARNYDGSYLTYSQMSERLVPYVKDMAYTHVEFMPVMEHPFEGSWGYQATGYFAPTARYGSPEELMALIDNFHRNGIGVILDWPAGHFCKDEHGLRRFDGTMLYEMCDHPQWGTCKFDYSAGQVRSFLLSNAHFWCDVYHADGIRVDGVSSMLCLNFGIENENDKVYNIYGGEDDLNAIKFLKDLNRNLGVTDPGIMMIAEESTEWPMVTAPPESGGLGFHYKWDMGWMNDTLRYMKVDFPFRKGVHNLLTFSMVYAYNENFIVALSHDEVVHLKGSMLNKMPGDYWQKFAGLRALIVYQMTHTGSKLNFMGYELGEFIEWRYYESLEWFLLDEFDSHRKHKDFVKEMNLFYKNNKALWEISYHWEGFEWLDADNNDQSVLLYMRKGKDPNDFLIILINLTPSTYWDYRVGVPQAGVYEEVFNSDDERFGGSGQKNPFEISSQDWGMHGRGQSINITLPPLSGVIFRKKY